MASTPAKTRRVFLFSRVDLIEKTGKHVVHNVYIMYNV